MFPPTSAAVKQQRNHVSNSSKSISSINSLHPPRHYGKVAHMKKASCSLSVSHSSLLRSNSSSFVVRRSSFVVRRSSFVVRRSSFVVRRSSFVVRRWLFVVRRSSFVIVLHLSSFFIRWSTSSSCRKLFAVSPLSSSLAVVSRSSLVVSHYSFLALHSPFVVNCLSSWSLSSSFDEFYSI